LVDAGFEALAERQESDDLADNKLIAATALIHDRTVVTRNVVEFAGTGARVLNPFE
jgi:predicted nucleic acid-binding protein